MSDNKLLDCPFCGGEAEVYVATKANYGYWPEQLAVQCKGCGTVGRKKCDSQPDRISGDFKKARENAVREITEDWNRRA